MEAMITYSDKDSTRALLKLLHDRNDLPAMHAELRDLGPGDPTDERHGPADGTELAARADPHDVDGHSPPPVAHRRGSGRLWTRPDGSPVLASILPDSSRRYLKGLLAEQGYHEALSTSNFCGAPNTRPRIPALVPERWINPDGTVTAGGYPYGRDVRPCNAAAEVTFGHKTGLTFNYGANAGIVHSLAGKPERHYVISFMASLGYRYTDSAFAYRSTYPCYDPIGAICYTQRIPALARQIDDYLKLER
jgi:hypothetical protein